ncbi:CBR-DGN-1 protein [Ditylenchus destructor]|nr:CBR-DGN-1 protein [Ditylenchus destructor]
MISYSSSSRPKIGNMSMSASSRPLLSMWFLSTMGLLLLACAVNGPDQMPALSGQAPMGALYRGHVFIKSEDVELFNASLPNWFQVSLAPAEADYDTSDPRDGHEKFRLVGIPQLKDVGRHIFILSGEGKTREIQVTKDTTNDCGEVGTAWIEILDPRVLTDVSVNEQITTVQNLLQTFTNTIGESSMKNSLSDFQIFPLKYVNQYRAASTTFSDEFGQENGNIGLFSPDQMLIALNISCGELNNEYPNEVISVVSDNSAIFKVVGGNLNQNRPPPLDTTTTVPVTRTTRQVHYRPVDNKPMAINRLSTFTCKKGLLCQLSIVDNTFLDVEDGDTRRLSLSVNSTGDEQQKTFLLTMPQSTQLEGVPLEAGTFTFRLNDRDCANQTASSPFQEIGSAYDKAQPNHQYSMILEGALHKFTSKPEMLRDFTYRLTDSLYGESASTLQAIARHDFRGLMGAQFHVKTVTLEFIGQCLNPVTPFFIGTIRTTTTKVSVDSEAAPSLVQTLLIPLILLAFLLLFIMLLILLRYIQRTGAQQKPAKRFMTIFVNTTQGTKTLQVKKNDRIWKLKAMLRKKTFIEPKDQVLVYADNAEKLGIVQSLSFPGMRSTSFPDT